MWQLVDAQFLLRCSRDRKNLQLGDRARVAALTFLTRHPPCHDRTIPDQIMRNGRQSSLAFPLNAFPTLYALVEVRCIVPMAQPSAIPCCSSHLEIANKQYVRHVGFHKRKSLGQKQPILYCKFGNDRKCCTDLLPQLLLAIVIIHLA